MAGDPVHLQLLPPQRGAYAAAVVDVGHFLLGGCVRCFYQCPAVFATQSADLSEQQATHLGPWGITVSGGEAPTPARKWLHLLEREHTTEGVHWMTWKPLKGQRTHRWMQWVWGNIHSANCRPTWETDRMDKCDLCHQHHQGIAHQRLVGCSGWATAFRQAWLDSWGDRSRGITPPCLIGITQPS